MTDQQKKYILAIDHGTSGIKAAIVSIHGDVVDYEYEKTAISFLPDGGAEQDPDDWWQALLKTASRLVAKKNGQPGTHCSYCCFQHIFHHRCSG